MLQAVLNQDEELVSELLHSDPNCIVEVDEASGRTLILIAVDLQNEQMLQDMLKYCQNNDLTNVRDKLKRFPLQVAVSNGNGRIVELLLEQPNIDVNLTDDNGVSSLVTSVKKGESSDSITYKLLQYSNIDVNSQSIKKECPLISATNNQNLRLIETLCNHNDLNINIQGEMGKTALICACERGYVSIIEKLLSIGNVDLNFGCDTGDTALSFAARYGRDYVLSKLVERNDIELNSTNLDGNSPLMIACKYNQFDFVKQFLSLENEKINLNLKNKNGSRASDLTTDVKIKRLLKASGENSSEDCCTIS